MLDMGFIKEKAWSDGHKETFANGLLFFRLQSYLLNMPSNTQLESRFPKAWPYSLVIKSGEICSPYTPQSDYSIWIGVFPRLLVEVNSGNSAHGQVNPEDYTRLLLQGSSSIRLMNHIRRCKGEQKPAVLMVIYIDKECNARRLLLFQKERSHVSSEVYYTHVTDNLQTCEGRLRLARVLYNLVDALDTDTCDSAFEESKEVVETLIALKRHAKGPAFSSKRQHATEKENETNSSKRQRQHEIDQDTLKRAGYGLVPDVVENDHGTFEPWFKRPPHIYYVYQIGDTDKKEYVMKRIRHHSNEKHILQSFTTKPSCDNIIQMVEMIESSVDTFVVFPKLGSVFEALQFGGRPLCGRLVDMSRDLARGLIFLHNNNIAHLDINPSNLGFTDKYHLQIFDFDISVQVNGEDEQIDDYLGTEGWMAPEIGTRDGPRQPYSPIRADKYSCGRVFRVFADTNGGVDEDLGQFAGKLMHPNPSKRPHLLEWCGPATLTQTNSAEMDKTMVADDEAMVTEEAMVAEGTMVAEVVEDEQKVVAPKRPRVGYGGEGFHQVPM
ncbi:kinase-like domain-containing protein [Lactarius hatsudake]|nr:kinase-like domain-containing protein [Lactarius hatsudake]